MNVSVDPLFLGMSNSLMARVVVRDLGVGALDWRHRFRDAVAPFLADTPFFDSHMR